MRESFTSDQSSKGKAPTTRNLPQILFVSSYPPRECGIATYTQDLIAALNSKFENSFKLKICALENESEIHQYPKEVKYILNTQHEKSFSSLANIINLDKKIEMIVFQHEFGFYADCKESFISMLKTIEKTKVVAFHTVLPNVETDFKQNVIDISNNCHSVIVMTEKSKSILVETYGIAAEKIAVLPHGTHLVEHLDKAELKKKYGVEGRQILSTFGLLSSGKSIETTLQALPDVVNIHPNTLFLIIGKTHPGVVKHEGERYREMLQSMVEELGLGNHVKFINKYVPLNELLEYLQLTDIYLFTSKDPNQAVSGTFSYAASCGCAIISTPIPHAVEYLDRGAGMIIDFQSPSQLSKAINEVFSNDDFADSLRLNGLQRIVATAWENAAIGHASLFSRLLNNPQKLEHKLPEIKLSHIKKMTTDFGMIQFSKLNQPDPTSGYTLDDNARALIAMCEHLVLTGESEDLNLIETYLDFIGYCQQPDGTFLNYVDILQNFSIENTQCNLEDANGRAIWALGALISSGFSLPEELVLKAETILERAMPNLENIHSPRAMAFIIKGLYKYNRIHESKAVRLLMKRMADRLTQMYLHESSIEWQWFESYMTYANSILPEALLLAYDETREITYREVAHNTFKFLISKIFTSDNDIKVISNRTWHQKGEEQGQYGEQPIDVAYTIITLNTFYQIDKEQSYLTMMTRAFEWFLGRNHLNHIIYNPRTGGCYDGLEEFNVNLNQGAESTVSYLLARLAVENARSMQEMRQSKVVKLKLENYAFKA